MDLNHIDDELNKHQQEQVTSVGLAKVDQQYLSQTKTSTTNTNSNNKDTTGVIGAGRNHSNKDNHNSNNDGLKDSYIGMSNVSGFTGTGTSNSNNPNSNNDGLKDAYIGMSNVSDFTGTGTRTRNSNNPNSNNKDTTGVIGAGRNHRDNHNSNNDGLKDSYIGMSNVSGVIGTGTSNSNNPNNNNNSHSNNNSESNNCSKSGNNGNLNDVSSPNTLIISKNGTCTYLDGFEIPPFIVNVDASEVNVSFCGNWYLVQQNGICKNVNINSSDYKQREESLRVERKNYEKLRSVYGDNVKPWFVALNGDCRFYLFDKFPNPTQSKCICRYNGQPCEADNHFHRSYATNLLQLDLLKMKHACSLAKQHCQNVSVNAEGDIDGEFHRRFGYMPHKLIGTDAGVVNKQECELPLFLYFSHCKKIGMFEEMGIYRTVSGFNGNDYEKNWCKYKTKEKYVKKLLKYYKKTLDGGYSKRLVGNVQWYHLLRCSGLVKLVNENNVVIDAFCLKHYKQGCIHQYSQTCNDNDYPNCVTQGCETSPFFQRFDSNGRNFEKSLGLDELYDEKKDDSLSRNDIIDRIVQEFSREVDTSGYNRVDFGAPGGSGNVLYFTDVGTRYCNGYPQNSSHFNTMIPDADTKSGINNCFCAFGMKNCKYAYVGREMGAKPIAIRYSYNKYQLLAGYDQVLVPVGLNAYDEEKDDILKEYRRQTKIVYKGILNEENERWMNILYPFDTCHLILFCDVTKNKQGKINERIVNHGCLVCGHRVTTVNLSNGKEIHPAIYQKKQDGPKYVDHYKCQLKIVNKATGRRFKHFNEYYEYFQNEYLKESALLEERRKNAQNVSKISEVNAEIKKLSQMSPDELAVYQQINKWADSDDNGNNGNGNENGNENEKEEIKGKENKKQDGDIDI